MNQRIVNVGLTFALLLRNRFLLQFGGGNQLITPKAPSLGFRNDQP
jgi:hypothetical protein